MARGPENILHCDGEGTAAGPPAVCGHRRLLPHISADQEAQKRNCCYSAGFLLSPLCSGTESQFIGEWCPNSVGLPPQLILKPVIDTPKREAY